MDTQICRVCKKEKGLDAYPTYKAERKNRGLVECRRLACRDCVNDFNRDNLRTWRKENPAKYFEQVLQGVYGLSTSEYQGIWTNQSGLCAICERPNNQKGKRLHIDHVEDPFGIRGLLCMRCNTYLSWIEETPDRLSRISEYLKRPPYVPISEPVWKVNRKGRPFAGRRKKD